MGPGHNAMRSPHLSCSAASDFFLSGPSVLLRFAFCSTSHATAAILQACSARSHRHRIRGGYPAAGPFKTQAETAPLLVSRRRISWREFPAVFFRRVRLGGRVVTRRGVLENASAKAAPLSTSLRTWDLGISRTYGRFLGIAGRVFCLFSYGCHICCVSILLETLVFPINLYVHNNVKDVESGAAKADPTGCRRRRTYAATM